MTEQSAAVEQRRIEQSRAERSSGRDTVVPVSVRDEALLAGQLLLTDCQSLSVSTRYRCLSGLSGCPSRGSGGWGHAGRVRMGWVGVREVRTGWGQLGWARDWTSTHPCTTQTLPLTLQYMTTLAIVTAIVITIITIAIAIVPFYVNVT